MSKLSPSHCFSMQSEQVQGPPDGLPLGEGGSHDSMTQSDAAAICAGLMRKCYLAGRVFHGRDSSSIKRLEAELYVEAAGLAERERWTLCVGQTTLKGLSMMAVGEWLDPCYFRTEAAKVVYFGKHIKIAPSRVWPVWIRTWRPRYVAVYQILERWGSIADGHVEWRQRENT